VRILADVSNRTGGTLDVLVNNAGSTSSLGLVRLGGGYAPTVGPVHCAWVPVHRDPLRRAAHSTP
jgi:NAD(P)-dependent dehydrogenase (short-subunit alcohol dehydrogenase family)